jgi:hypothetical protein
MSLFKKCALVLGAAQCLFAQTTGPTTDVYQNMNGEVSILKYILQPNTRVSMANFKDWVTWGAVSRTCDDPTNDERHNTAFFTTKKIGTKLGLHFIQHCHGPVIPGTSESEDGIQEKGTTSFSWSDGQLYPKKAINSKWAFYTHHNILHFIPVTQGVPVSARIWLTTHAPNWRTSPVTGIQVMYYPGWMYPELAPDGTDLPTPVKTNEYHFAWENNSTPTDHAYTLNFTPPFTGAIGIRVGPDAANGPGADVWLKALTMQDGTSNGVVPLGSFVKNTYEQQHYIKFRNSGKVMVPDFGIEDMDNEGIDPDPGEPVKQYTQSLTNKNQKWYIHPSSAFGYSNIWTKDGALTSGPYWWQARTRKWPTLTDPWQQVQFVDQGNGYSKIKLGGKGPSGEDLYLISYSADEGDDVGVYYGGLGGQEVQILKADPKGGARYQLQMVHSGKCLGVLNGSTSDNAAVVQMPCNSSQTRQLADMIDLAPASGVYKYGFAHTTTRRMDINAGSTSSGASVVNRATANTTSQQLVLMEYGDDTYSMYFKHSGLCLDIPAFSTADNAQAKQYACNGGNNQRFRFIRN